MAACVVLFDVCVPLMLLWSRLMITEREELLEASAGSGGRQSVILSSKIRETLTPLLPDETPENLLDLTCMNHREAGIVSIRHPDAVAYGFSGGAEVGE